MISIIVPIYNTKKYLRECLDSILNQTFFDYELLLIDDGSTDGSSDIIKEYAAKDTRIRVLGGRHIGFPLSKNLGLDSAKGDYICFVDSDDSIHPQYLEILYNTIINTKADLCSCRYIPYKSTPKIIFKETGKVVEHTEDRILSLFNSLCATFMWNKIYKRELFDDIRFEDVMALSDTMVMYKIVDKAKKIATVDKSLIYYRVHPANMTHHVRSRPEYWVHRLKVHTDMYIYLYERYPQYRDIICGYFRAFYNGEIQHKVDKTIIEDYNNRKEIQKLLCNPS